MTIAEDIRASKRTFIIGNGGSYANACHMANDLFSVGVRAMVLDPATLTMVANDFGYEFIFSKWLMQCAEAGDTLIALSGSGTSPNIVNAVEAAKLIGMRIHLITDYLKTRDMQQSEEDQIVLAHRLMRELRA